jgi:NAD(P)-dependent dehydrogenase (short-subunit alcohol dehydrogenase family)
VRSFEGNAQSPRPVLVVIGAGSIGLAVARRLGAGKHLVLADASPERLAAATTSLVDEGHSVVAVPVDIRDAASVGAVRDSAAELGTIMVVVNAAGVSAGQATPRDILAVDLLGAAHIIDEFLPTASRGTVLVCISSAAGYRERVDQDLEDALAWTPAVRLLDIPALNVADGVLAYHLAKRGVQLRVLAASIAWGRRGARVVCVSPGIVETPMSRAERRGPGSERITAMMAALPVPRIATPDDVASAVEFLCSPAASYICGADLLVDGGAAATMRWGNLTPPDAAGLRPY